MGVEGRGRRIETPSTFTADDGGADPRLLATLSSFEAGSATYSEVIEIIGSSRLLVPVVAVLEERDDTGADKSSHMATVTLVQADGRRGLLAFTSVESLRNWNADARPVPAFAVDVCAAAMDEGAQGVLVDIAGPIRFAVDGQALEALAALARQNATSRTDD